MDTAMNMKAFTLLLMILLYVDVSAAAKLTVYRWVDKNNIVHFSQNQPDHDNYIEMSMTNNKSLSTVVNKKKSPEDAASNNQFNADTSKQRAVDNSMCIAARENIKTLQNFDKIQYKDTNDNAKILTVLEKKQQLAMNKKQAEVYCQK